MSRRPGSSATTDAAVPDLPGYGTPVLDTGQDDGPTVLQAQVTELLAGGLRGLSAADVRAFLNGAL